MTALEHDMNAGMKCQCSLCMDQAPWESWHLQEVTPGRTRGRVTKRLKKAEGGDARSKDLHLLVRFRNQSRRIGYVTRLSNRNSSKGRAQVLG
jgi:hypothetical protein